MAGLGAKNIIKYEGEFFPEEKLETPVKNEAKSTDLIEATPVRRHSAASLPKK